MVYLKDREVVAIGIKESISHSLLKNYLRKLEPNLSETILKEKVRSLLLLKCSPASFVDQAYKPKININSLKMERQLIIFIMAVQERGIDSVKINIFERKNLLPSYLK